MDSLIPVNSNNYYQSNDFSILDRAAIVFSPQRMMITDL
jgi:hypothetical protein